MTKNKNKKQQKNGNASDIEMKQNGEEYREEKTKSGTAHDNDDSGCNGEEKKTTTEGGGQFTAGSSVDTDMENETTQEKELTPEERICELEKQLKEAQDKYLRAKAEFDNYKKRMQKEFGEIRTYTKANTIEQFLSVFDHFQMAMEHMGEDPDVQTLKQGMDMIYEELRNTFETLGVKKVDAEGQTFDPAEHEAMAEENSEEIPAGKVIRQWKCGYRLGDRLIRPATVVVSKGPAEKEGHKENDEGGNDAEQNLS